MKFVIFAVFLLFAVVHTYVIVPSTYHHVYSSGFLVPKGHGLEGQYFTDVNHLLYDDGTYKPWFYGL
ncbi:hypothetical protein WA026_017881 [Henosepilachna vigintioctopunctata]|uniref:Uncharacterized protein n=1 Tax=Henosepilachna vigintioctopunctata TaxID=420089 RepID=A0AAW1TQ15_9CUCU